MRESGAVLAGLLLQSSLKSGRTDCIWRLFPFALARTFVSCRPKTSEVYPSERMVLFSAFLGALGVMVEYSCRELTLSVVRERRWGGRLVLVLMTWLALLVVAKYVLWNKVDCFVVLRLCFLLLFLLLLLLM